MSGDPHLLPGPRGLEHRRVVTQDVRTRGPGDRDYRGPVHRAPGPGEAGPRAPEAVGTVMAPGAVVVNMFVIEHGLHGSIGHSLHRLGIFLVAAGA